MSEPRTRRRVTEGSDCARRIGPVGPNIHHPARIDPSAAARVTGRATFAIGDLVLRVPRVRRILFHGRIAFPSTDRAAEVKREILPQGLNPPGSAAAKGGD